MYTEDELSANPLPSPEVGVGGSKTPDNLIKVDGVAVINDALAVFGVNVEPGRLTG